MSRRPPRLTLTAAVLARDAASVLGECLRSVAFADECLVLVDAATHDDTRALARSQGARVEERVFDTFAAQRDAALTLATGDWVLFVDADERVTPALQAEVLASLEAPVVHSGFWIPRHNYLMGRLVRHAGWFPDYQLRLLDRTRSHFDPLRRVHELAVVDGSVGYLKQPLVHFNYRDLAEFVRKQERYCRLEAESWLASFGPPRPRALLGQPMREFWRRFVQLEGYREGWLGFVLSALLGYYAGKTVWLARCATLRPRSAAAPRW